MTHYNIADLQATVLMLDGKPARLQIEGAIIDLTVRQAFRTALGSTFQDEQNLTLEKKMIRYETSKLIWNADDHVELTTEQQSELKNCVNKAYSGEIHGYLMGVVEKKQGPAESSQNGKEKSSRKEKTSTT